jgi:serine O-acetyltransferase
MKQEIEKTLWQIIKRDAKRWIEGPFQERGEVNWDLKRVVFVLMLPQFQLVLRYRLYHWLSKNGYKFAAFLFYLNTHKKYSCDISLDAKIGAGLRIEHCADVVIGPEAVIGREAIIYNGVTLGKRLGRSGVDGMPVLGDRVIVGTGAKLLGAIEIGDDARIGANSVVLSSVPANCSAVGSPARILRDQARFSEEPQQSKVINSYK